MKIVKPINPVRRAANPGKEKVSALLDLADLPGNTIKADLPLTLQPQLATLVDGPPSDPAEWTYEIKFDGYRILTRIDGKKIQLFTRNGNDWSHKLPHIVKAIGEMGLAKRLAGWRSHRAQRATAFRTSRPCKMHLTVHAHRTSSIMFLIYRSMTDMT